jgi:AraC-like DNA-binding protein
LNKPKLRISSLDLDRLIDTLTVHFVALSECLVSSGHRLELRGVNTPGIHYNLVGTGKMLIGDNPPIDVRPHTLIVVPSGCPVLIEVADRSGMLKSKTVDGRSQTTSTDGIPKFVAGDGKPEIILICGYFNASYGPSADLFGRLASPIIEQFAKSDRIDDKLKSALSELVAQEVGFNAMSAAMLKQVIIALLRRSLSSLNLWVDRFSILSDQKIARAFAEMAANPGNPHTVTSLAKHSALSRSAFMTRFTEVVGSSPIKILRYLRMRQAAQQLRASGFSIDQIAHNAGYENRSGFARAFRRIYGIEPSAYRAAWAAGKHFDEYQ